jgi:DNA ligase-1
MRRFAETGEAVGSTSSKKEKVRLVSQYLQTLPLDDAARAAVFFCGRAFPRSEERVLAAGGSMIWEAVTRLAGASAGNMDVVYRKHGDLGAMAEELLASVAVAGTLSLADVAAAFDKLAATRFPAAKRSVLQELLGRADALTAKYIIKIMTGDLRIGLKESLVEEAIAQAFEQPPDAVRRANMLTGDIGAALRMAAAGTLADAKLRLFQPIGFMLASPVESAAEALAQFPEGALIEDKYDGIRAQVHKSGGAVRMFSRTLDEIVEFFELLEPLAKLPGDFVLDGEVVAWRDGRALPFTELQQRLGRKQPELWLPLEIPVSFVAFDLLYVDGEPLLDRPLAERRNLLQRILSGAEAPAIQLAAAAPCDSAALLETAFAAALARGNEGVMIKDPASLYLPGRRGRWWLKWKRPLATLDVVVTAVEYGHGKRHGLLSDFTFAVRGEDGLVNIGKAYTGLTDEEIRRLTQYFLEHTVADQGFRRTVEPNVVIEVAFNNIQQSGRHDSGCALRFPRIVRLRPDKSAEEIDTVERVRELYAKQGQLAK